MTDRELMQQALEALELLAWCENPATRVQVRKPRAGGPIVTMYPHKVATEAAAPLRERLAQLEQPEWADKCRIELVTAIHSITSDYENALGAFGEDAEARRKAEGDIAHARKVASRWNWNGAGNQPVKEKEPDSYGYASRLATHLWQKHYMKDAPQWKPFDDLMGVLTQIDNMTTGLTRLARQEQEPVAHVTVAGVLFDFMGWLTSRKERLVLSSSDEASPAVEVIQEFAKMRGLSLADADVKNWQQALAAAPLREWVGLTESEKVNVALDCGCADVSWIELADAIEAKLQQKNI